MEHNTNSDVIKKVLQFDKRDKEYNSKKIVKTFVIYLQGTIYHFSPWFCYPFAG